MSQRIHADRVEATNCASAQSQKAANLARDNRLSLTVNGDASQVMQITGLSMAAHASPVTDPAEGEKVMRMLVQKYPPQESLPMTMPRPADVCIFRLSPIVISVLDYPQGFGHTDLVAVEKMGSGR